MKWVEGSKTPARLLMKLYHFKEKWMSAQTKKCLVCQVKKPLSDFYTDSQAKDRKKPRCKECSAADNKRFRQAREALVWTDVPASKKCSRCKEERPMEQFSIHKTSKFGRRVTCKQCEATNRSENWPKVRLNAIRHKAIKQLNLPFDLDADFIESLIGDGSCHSCGKMCGHSLEVDRVLPQLGYVKGNVGGLCPRCNSIKLDAGIEDLVRVIDYIKKKYSCF